MKNIVNEKRNIGGISLVVLVLTVIVVIILASAVVLNLVNGKNITNTTNAALKTDMQAMLDKQLVTYQEALYKASGDSSKITNDDFVGVIPDKYKGDFEATKGGIVYKGNNESTKEIAKEMGFIVTDSTLIASGIENLELVPTTSTIQIGVVLKPEFSNVNKFVYYISSDGGATWEQKESSNKSEIINELIHNTNYKVKVEAEDENGNKLNSNVMEISTKRLDVSDVELRIENASGDIYENGSWTNKGVYIGILNTNIENNVRTTYEVSGANTLSERSKSSIIENSGVSTILVKTTDGKNTVSKEYEVKIDNVAPTGYYTETVSTNQIKVQVLNATDDLSQIDSYSYYLDDILKYNGAEGSYTYSGLNVGEKHNIKVVVADKAGNENILEKRIMNEEVPSGETNITYSLNPSTSTNGTVTVNITYRNIAGFDLVPQYSEDGYNYVDVNYNHSVQINKNMSVYARYRDNNGQTGVRKEIVISNIAKSKPLVKIEPNGGNYVIPNGKTEATLKSKVTVTDSGDSIIKSDSLEYIWSKSKTPPTSGYTKFNNGDNITKTDATEGVWYLYVKAENEAGVAVIEKSNPYIVGKSDDVNNGIQILVSPKGYTNKDVTVTIIYGKSLTKELKAGYGDNVTIAKNNANESNANGFNMPKNGYIYATGKDGAGNEVTKTLNVNNIDKEVPKINVSVGSATKVKSVTLNITAIDTGVSGLDPNNKYEYSLSTSNTEAPVGKWNTYVSGQEFTIGEDLTGTYYLWVKKISDRATNKSDGGNKVGDYNVFGSYVFRNKITITFDSNGGSEPTYKVMQVTSGGAYGELPETSREGYVFDGWYTEKTGGSKITETTIVTNLDDHTLYARWIANGYTVTFDPNGGEAVTPSSKDINYGDTYGTLPNATRKYTINYEYNGATSGNSRLSEVVSYTFDGWYKSLDFSSKVESTTVLATPSDHTLYAKWTKRATTLPAPSRDGYYLYGWYSDSGFTVKVGDAGDEYVPTRDVTLYAKWVAKKYVVTFDPNGGQKPSPENKEVEYDSTYGEMPVPNRRYTVKFDTNYTGGVVKPDIVEYRFDGWYKESTFVNKVESTTQVLTPQNHTLYAKWISGKINLRTFEREGYIIEGWYKEAGCVNKVGNAGDEYIPTSDITLYAKWTKRKYTVTFDPNGGETPTPENKEVTFAEAYGSLPTATREYTVTYEYNGATSGNTKASDVARYTFGGWYKEVTLENKIESSTIVNTIGSHKLYAKWTEASVVLPTPVKEGAKFEGWFADLEYIKKIGNAGDRYVPTSNVTLYAKWSSTSYVVTFNPNGGTATNPGTKEVQSGVTYGKLPGTSRSYVVTYNHNYSGSTNATATSTYVFDGWYSDSALTKRVDETTRVTILSNHTLYAKWIPVSVTLRSPTRPGYRFDGWYKEAACTNKVGDGGASYTPTANITLYAKWTPLNYTVTFAPNGGATPNPASKIVTYTQAYGDLPTPIREYTVTYQYNGATSGNTSASSKASYVFGGWYKENTFQNKVVSSTIVNTIGDHTLYAKWSSTNVTLPTPARTGYAFGGWYSNAACTNKIGDGGASYTPTANITLYAKWTANTYYVKYNGNGATSGSMSNSTHTYDVEKTLTTNAYGKSVTVTLNYNGATGNNSTSNKTYTSSFNGWNSNSNGTGDYYANGAKVKNLTATPGGTYNIYAQWSTEKYGTLPTPTKSYTVTYNHNYTGSTNSTATSNYTFGGWYKEASFSNKVESTTNVTNYSNHTLYAKWTSKSVTLSTPTRTGYTFGGWYSNAACTNKVGNGGASYTPTANITLYAKWTESSYTVTYNANGGTGTMSTDTVKYNESYTTRANGFSRAGYTFKGWNERADGTGTDWTSYIGRAWTWTYTKSVTLYAQWKDEIAPSLSLEQTAVGCQSLSVKATFSDNESGMNKIEWYVDGTLKNTDTYSTNTNATRSYVVNGGTSGVAYTIKVIAYDNAGNKTEKSITVTTTPAVCGKYNSVTTCNNNKSSGTNMYAAVQTGVDSITTGTLYMLKNSTQTAVVASGKNITLNLNGFTYTAGTANSTQAQHRSGTYAISNSGTLTVTGSGTMTGVTVDAIIYSSGTFTLSGGTVSVTGACDGNTIIISGGTFNMSGGSIIASNTGQTSALKFTGSASGTMSGGNITSTTTGSCLNYTATGTINITGGTISTGGSSTASGVVNTNTGTVKISGTANIDVCKVTSGSSGIANTGSGSIQISGGTINGNYGVGVNNSINGSVTITAGTIKNSTASSTYNKGATIQCTSQAGYSGAIGTVTMSGGTVTNNGNGIGVFISSYGKFVLNGGLVSSASTEVTIYCQDSDGFSPSSGVASNIPNYVKNTGGGHLYCLNGSNYFGFKNYNKFNLASKL